MKGIREAVTLLAAKVTIKARVVQLYDHFHGTYICRLRYRHPIGTGNPALASGLFGNNSSPGQNASSPLQGNQLPRKLGSSRCPGVRMTRWTLVDFGGPVRYPTRGLRVGISLVGLGWSHVSKFIPIVVTSSTIEYLATRPSYWWRYTLPSYRIVKRIDVTYINDTNGGVLSNPC
jgi:hypothetical protein